MASVEKNSNCSKLVI